MLSIVSFSLNAEVKVTISKFKGMLVVFQGQIHFQLTNPAFEKFMMAIMHVNLI